MTGTEEQRLWQRWAQRRDRGAFEALVAHLQVFAFDFARRVTGHDADAADLAQEALVELSGTDPQTPAAVGLKAFLGRHIHLGAKMLRRAALTRTRHEHAAAEARERAAQSAREPQGQETEEALALLDADQRRAVELRFLHGLSYREIGHVLGISELNARVRVHRALKRLRERLGPRTKASLAALALFSPPSRFVSHTVRTAVAVGGVLAVTSILKKTLVVAILLAATATGAYVWRTGSRDSGAQRADVPERRASAKRQTDGDVLKPSTDDDAQAPAAAPTAPAQARTWSGHLKGRVVLDDGTPFAHRTLALWGYEQVTAKTDADGRFELAGVYPGERTLYIAEPGFDFAIFSTEVGAHDVSDIAARVERGQTLRGTILSGRDVVSGATLTLRRQGARGSGAAVQADFAFLKTDAQGHFAVPLLPSGSYTLAITADGFEPAAVRLQVTSVPAPAPLTLQLKRAVRLTFRFDNLPPEWRRTAVYVAIHNLDGREIETQAEGRLDESNSLGFDAPPPGRYHFETLPGGKGVLPRMRQTVTITRAAGQTVVFRLPDGARVTGTLRDVDGAVVARARLFVEGADLYATTDTRGRFVFPRVPTGQRVFSLAAGQRRLRRAEIPTGGALQLDLRFPGTAEIRGRVDAKGPNYAKSVALFDLSDAEKPMARHDLREDGSFVLPHLAPGTYRLVAFAYEAPALEQRVTVDRGSVDVGTLLVEPYVRIPLRVAAPTAVKLAGKHYATWSGGLCRYELDGHGHGHLWGLPLGTHIVHFTLTGTKQTTTEVRVETQDSPTVRVTLELK